MAIVILLCLCVTYVGQRALCIQLHTHVIMCIPLHIRAFYCLSMWILYPICNLNHTYTIPLPGIILAPIWIAQFFFCFRLARFLLSFYLYMPQSLHTLCKLFIAQLFNDIKALGHTTQSLHS